MDMEQANAGAVRVTAAIEHGPPTRKFVTVEDIGAFTVFLCQDAAKSITGAALPIEGGWTAQ